MSFFILKCGCISPSFSPLAAVRTKREMSIDLFVFECKTCHPKPPNI